MGNHSFQLPKVVDTISDVSEAHQDFEETATPEQRKAADVAQKNAGVAERGKDWERTASPEQRRDRLEESRRKEKKPDEKLEQELDGSVVAKYKIEITFVARRNLHSLNHVGISIWESGKKFHGGGDELMYWCKDNRDGHDDGCWSPIPGDCIRGEVAICPKCHRAVNSELLTNMRIGNVSMTSLSQELVKIFRSLGSNCDIYLKFHKTDIRYIAMEKAKGPDVARRLKGMAIYPLKNIIKDTQNGSDLAKKFKAFVTA